MQLNGGNGGVDTRPPTPDQTAHYTFDPAPQAGWWEQRDRQPAALWILLGGAVVAGVLLLVAYMALTSSGDTVTGAGDGGGEAAAEAEQALASPNTETDVAGAETFGSDTADDDASAAADTDDAAAAANTAAPSDEQPETLAVTGSPDGATPAPSTPAETSTTAVETTVTTAPPATEAPTTQPPTTEPPATEAPTTQPPATEAPTTQPSATDPPATDPPATTAAPTTQPPTTEAPTTQPPATQPPATDPPTAAGNDAAAQQQVLDLTNAERANNGCPALQLNQTLNGVADGHSEDMAARNYFDHNDPEGNGPGVRIDASGYQGRGWGENIAAGYRSAAAVVEGWMNSEGHRRNILNCNFNELGVGYAEGGSYGVYWTQVFGTR